MLLSSVLGCSFDGLHIMFRDEVHLGGHGFVVVVIHLRHEWSRRWMDTHAPFSRGIALILEPSCDFVLNTGDSRDDERPRNF